MHIEMIPLNKLVPSPANVRRTGANAGIEELAASIKAHGLLQNLQVREGAGNKFEVVAGGRRLGALKLLLKKKTLTAKTPIACHVLGDEDAGEISLAENVMRMPMHPADQFEAFRALAETGKGPEDIAARFGTTAATVRQRLKLAGVSARLFAAYREDEMTLDQLMAFTVSDDHAAQEAVWTDLAQYNRSPAAIRKALTAAHVSADDKRVSLVGLDVYREAGGAIVRDLFQPDHEGYLTDAALLDRLVDERLETEAAAIRAEGWKWVEIALRLDRYALQGFGRVHAERLPLSPEREDEVSALAAQYDALAEEHGDDPEDEIAEQMEALSEKIDLLSEREAVWEAQDIAQAGAIVSIGYGGGIEVERGLIRPEDKKTYAIMREGDDEVCEQGTDRAASSDPAAAFPARLVEDLTAQRTAALRKLLADDHRVALATVAHALTLPLFYRAVGRRESCLTVDIKSRDLRSSAERIAESSAATALRAQVSAWKERLPAEAADLFGWLLTQDTATVTGLIAVCAAGSLDAVRGKQDRHDCPRLAHADELAQALGLDMAQWWQPTKASYLGRVSKPLILKAVAEGVSVSAAENLARLKKDAMAAHAEERLAGRSWLPAFLRGPSEMRPAAQAA
jgi:ParB family chromosome partitioning protein